MRRNWWETIKERQALWREQNGAADPREPKKRRPYQLGAKQFLSEFDKGERRQYNDRFPWTSLKSVASRMKSEYGVQFLFNSIKGVRYITRVV